jgi:glycosyltransferase involved in cell wall biosynthesis
MKNQISEKADAIYFLMWNGWKNELRSNRWHYASRWAKYLPVVLVQDCLPPNSLATSSEDEPRIDNCKILNIPTLPSEHGSMFSDVMSAYHIVSEMKKQGHNRPILWMYNPNYSGVYAIIPAVLRIYHLTENYFYFDKVQQQFLDKIIASVAISDLCIAVSEGVAKSHRPYAYGRVEVVTNGCDYGFYSTDQIDCELKSISKRWDKVAIYAGNINNRIDFNLIEKVALQFPDTLFALFGPVAGLNKEEQTHWEALKEVINVWYAGSVDVFRLPGLYASADVGLIPYKKDPILIDNTFPLKAFEMLSSGLPVVSTFMNALTSFSLDGLAVTDTDEDFVAAVNRFLHDSLDSPQRREIAKICQLQDYGVKFNTVLELIEKLPGSACQLRAPALSLIGYAEDFNSFELDNLNSLYKGDGTVQLSTIASKTRAHTKPFHIIKDRLSDSQKSKIIQYGARYLPKTVRNFIVKIYLHFLRRM